MNSMATVGPTGPALERPWWRRVMLLAALATVLPVSGCVITSGFPPARRPVSPRPPAGSAGSWSRCA